VFCTTSVSLTHVTAPVACLFGPTGCLLPLQITNSSDPRLRLACVAARVLYERDWSEVVITEYSSAQRGPALW
jgi:hypothetical protein